MSMESARKKSGLLQREVANALNVSMGTVAMWDTGRNMPRAGLLLDIANLYNCTVDELLKPDSGSNIPPNPTKGA